MNMRQTLSIILLVAPLAAHALVDMKNGNLALQWKDIDQPSPAFNLTLIRTWNSQSQTVGMLGRGWCIPAETRLQPTAEGNLVRTGCGTGRRTVFLRPDFTPGDLSTTIHSILNRIEAGSTLSEPRLSQLRLDLQADDNLRLRFARHFGLPVVAPPVDVELHENGQGATGIVRKGRFFILKRENGLSEIFDEQGRLVRESDANGNHRDYLYRDGQLREIRTVGGSYLRFYWNRQGRLVRLHSSQGLKVSYSYRQDGMLARVTDVDGNTVRYNYNERKLLTHVNYSDGDSLQVDYDDSDRVVATERDDGCRESYEWSWGNPAEGSLDSRVVKQCAGEEPVTFQYGMKLNPRPTDGQTRVVRSIDTRGGTERHREYDSIHGQMLVDKRQDREIRYSYSQDGLLEQVDRKGMTTLFRRDPQHRRVTNISWVPNDSETVDTGNRSINYAYDQKGNITMVTHKDGRQLQLKYQPKGKIVEMTDQASRTLRFRYDPRLGKPQRIEWVGHGVLRTYYDSQGEIQRVQSSAGPAMALTISHFFSQLNELVSPLTHELQVEK